MHRKIYKIKLLLILFLILSTSKVLSNTIKNCSNCVSKDDFGKIYHFEKKINSLNENQHVIFWQGFIGVNEVIITNKGLIKNSDFIKISNLNDDELCIFGITEFPSFDAKYPNSKENFVYSKKINIRYSNWKSQFNTRKIYEKNNFCRKKRREFISENVIESKYQCSLNMSSCKIFNLDITNNRVQKMSEISSSRVKTKFDLSNWIDSRICFFAVNKDKTDWTKNYQYISHVEEAKRRKLNCDIKEKKNKKEFIPKKYFHSELAWNSRDPLPCFNPLSKKVYLIPFEGTESRHGATRKCMGKDYRISMKDYKKLVPDQNVYENDKVICYKATDGWSGKWSFENLEYVKKAQKLGLSCGIAKGNIAKIIIKEDTESKLLAEQKSKELEQEKARRIEEEKERKILEAKTRKLAEEKRLAELKAKKRTEEIAKEVAAEKQKKIEQERALRKAEELKRKKAEERALKLAEERKKTEEVAKRLEQERIKAELKTKKLKEAQQIQLAALEKEKAEKQKLIIEEKKKRDELEKKLAALEEENKANRSKGNNVYKAKLPPEWMPFQNKMSIQQEQFCQLTDRFFKDMDKAIASRNDIRVNIVHQERQENLDALIPSGKISNWIFKVVKIEQVDDGSAAVVLSLQCKSFVGSGQVHTKSTWRKKSNKEWRATIPRDDRRFRELAKLGLDDFILGSGTLLEVNAFKPGQIETFYASQQIGEHPLTKDLNLEGELFLADLSYIAALN